MSGHSKWAKVKHQKALKDPKKGLAFSKISSLISVAAKENSNPETNPKLRLVIEKAQELGVPKENIEKAIKRGAGELEEKENWEELFCEAYGPHGSALLIQVATNNKNRTLAELRHLLQLHEAKLAEIGSVRWLFKEMTKIIIPKQFWNNNLSLQVIEKGTEEINEDEENIYLYTSAENFPTLKEFLISKKHLIPETSIKTEFDFLSQQPIIITDLGIKKKMEELFDALDEHPDVEEIYSNVEFKV